MKWSLSKVLKPKRFTRYIYMPLLLLCFIISNSFAGNDTLSTLSEVNAKINSTRSVYLLKHFTWDITIINSDNSVRKLVANDIDTIEFGKPRKVNLHASIYINPILRNLPAVIGYGANGSIKIDVNGITSAATGIFNKSDDDEMSVLNKKDYIHIVLKDSLLDLGIEYIPHVSKKIFSITTLYITTPEIAEKKKEAYYDDINSSFALGFYYLAFGIVFMILYLFFREKTENFYFSLFCVFSSLSWLVTTTENEDVSSFSVFCLVYALEFLSLFLAKVLANKNKSKLHLVVITIVGALCWLPAIKYNYIKFLGMGTELPLYKGLIIGGLLCYSGFASIYFLFQGFGEKRWEARVILYMCLSAVVVGMIAPIIISTFSVSSNNMIEYIHYAGYLAYLGLGMYPLSAAIVLGRRNGLNQKQLTQQVASIERLSNENLEKEKEKKQILEAQNTELEYKVKERTAEVMQQKEIIEIKNKSITDNLIYAQRIQSAILPDLKLINKTFEQSFIIYMPKDIVSGDFYSFAEKDGMHIIVAGDCTGHGVSGAFMSMIGSSLLNQIITEKDIAEPAQILNKLNTSVIDTLKQGETESNDGMDISICAFDLKTKTLQYAGANRPLWLIRNDEFILVKPDKYPIGGLQMARERTFQNNTLQLQTGDTIYIFTDGYADQFGGEKGKKLMSGKFKEILLSIQELDMPAQEKYLTAFFKKWKGHNEQVDDVLVMGIRV